MQITLENRKKAAVDFLKSVLKKKNKVELRMKREHENTNLRAQKMMKGKVEPFVVPTMIRAMPPMVHAFRQTTTVPQMTFP